MNEQEKKIADQILNEAASMSHDQRMDLLDQYKILMIAVRDRVESDRIARELQK